MGLLLDPGAVGTSTIAGRGGSCRLRFKAQKLNLYDMNTIQTKVGEPVSDELALVQAAKNGDVSAFEELVRRIAPNGFRIAQTIPQNPEARENFSQDAFLKASG